jgi:hypothetical protein
MMIMGELGSREVACTSELYRVDDFRRGVLYGFGEQNVFNSG